MNIAAWSNSTKRWAEAGNSKILQLPPVGNQSLGFPSFPPDRGADELRTSANEIQ